MEWDEMLAWVMVLTPLCTIVLIGAVYMIAPFVVPPIRKTWRKIKKFIRG